MVPYSTEKLQQNFIVAIL